MARLKTFIKRTVRFFRPPRIIKAEVGVIAPNTLLKDRTALITGGTSGIGYAIAKAFLQSGASVVVTGRNEEKAANAALSLQHYVKDGGRVIGLAMDNTKPKEFESKLDEINSLLGENKHIDILVNNAGVQGAKFGSANEEEYDLVMDTNLKGPFFLSQLIARRMVNEGIKGNILNICSASSLRPAGDAYTLSKVALKALTEGMAKTLVGKGIIVNGIAPGPTATPMLHRDAVGDISAPFNPLGRCALPEEIANMAVMLCSTLGRTIVGSVVYMTGGAGLLTKDDVKYQF